MDKTPQANLPKQSDGIPTGPRPRKLRAQTALICLLLATVTFISFWPLVNSGFINYDDQDYVTENPHVQAGLTWSGVEWAFRTSHASNWHPLTWLSHMLDVQLFGKGPMGPHCVNLLLHTFNSLLLFLLLKRLTGVQWPSALAAALFALHPLHVESVAWVAERKDVLSTFFGLLSLCAYARYCQLATQNSKLKTPSYILALLFFACGLMSKPMLVTLPFLMLLLDWWPLQRLQSVTKVGQVRTPSQLVWEKVPFLLLSAAACVATVWAQTQAIQPLEHLPLPSRVANAVVAYARYVGKTIWPANLALPYVHPGHWPASQVFGAAIFVAGACVVAFLLRRKSPFVFTGWFWFLGTMVPVIGLVQVGAQSMADRYTYIPSVGLFIILAWAAAWLVASWKVPRAVATAGAPLILLLCGARTREQAGYWHDSERLFKHSAAVTENNFIALANAGGALFKQGHLDEALELYQQAYRVNPRYAEAANSIGAVLASRGSDEAIEWFRKALALQPTHPDALFNVGNFMAKKGNTREASEYFEASLKAKPDNFEARNNLGNALFQLGRIDEAIKQYQLALDYSPDAVLIHKNLGEMLAAQGKLNEAVAQYHLALLHTNDAATHYSLGLALAVQGHWDEAIEQYVTTLNISPTNAEAHYNLGYALRVKGRLDEAADHLRQSVRLKSDFPLAHYNLACVLADQGLTEEARNHLNEALRQKPDYREASEKLKTLK
jgi:tetratricopeptide (TPR) repeat protein